MEKQNARRTAASNARQRTHDQHRCCIYPPQPNRVRSTRDVDLDRSSGAHEPWQTGSRTQRRANTRSADLAIRSPGLRGCLECGWRGQMLRRHLAIGHELDVAQYRARWNLPREHLMTAPGYSDRRSTLAKQAGLGQGRFRRGSRTPAAPKTPTPRRRPGRPQTLRS